MPRQVVTSIPATSTSRSVFGLPDFGKVAGGFGQLQPRLDTPNALQGAAVGQQQGLRGILSSLFGGFGQGQRARINQRFDTQANNAAGSLQNRGFAGSSLNLPAQLGVESGRQSAFGELDDELLGQRLGSESGISGRISDLLFGSSEQSTQLLKDLLGSGGIGTESRQTAGGKISTIGRGLTNVSGGARIGGGLGGEGSFGGGIQGGGLPQPGFPNNPLFQPGFPEGPSLSIPQVQF